jgi:ABC-type transport system involved in cytochrome c biogenesis permease subunit
MAGGLRAVPRKIRNILGSIKTGVVLLVGVVVVSAAGNLILQPPVTEPDVMQRAYSSRFLVFFLLRVRDGRYHSLLRLLDGSRLTMPKVGLPPAWPPAHSLLSGLVSGIFVSLLYLLLFWRRDDLERMLQSGEELDRITYRTIAIAFPLVTLMIAGGRTGRTVPGARTGAAIPKKRGPAITWLVYAGYLHTRITRGWRGRRAAYFAIFGFGVVMFTFFGVTYLLPGLHAYA